MNPNQCCVVTGGAGFIGCALSSALADRFGRVIAVDTLTARVHARRERPAALAPKVELWPLDIARPETWDHLLNEVTPSAIIHLAAETSTGQSLVEAANQTRVNVSGTAVMLDALSARMAFPERIILSGSRAVYGNGAWLSKDEEIVYPGHRTRGQLANSEWDFPNLRYLPAEARTTRPSPISVYAATKLAQEHLLTAWCAAYETLPIVLRLQNVYGRGQSLANPYTGIIPLFCRHAALSESIPLYEDGMMLRDFVLIDDIVMAFVKSLDTDAAGEHFYDVGTGATITLASVADRIADFYGAPSPHVCGRYRYGDVRHAGCSIEETRRALGWAPRHTLDEGLVLVMEWVDEQLAREER